MTYLYETIPDTEDQEVRRYEIKQSIHDATLTHHPETGDPIRRVIVGGMGFITGKSGNPKPVSSRPSHGGCGCGSGGCGHR
jgi:predicted nucleic acid-binding Zn ribbon protein